MTPRKQTQPDPVLHGYLPPQAPDIEAAILGAIITDRASFDDIAEILNPDVFYKHEHKTVFECLQSMYKKGKQIDQITLRNEVKNIGKMEEIGGDYFLSRLSNDIPYNLNIEAYAHIIKEKYYRRETLRLNHELSRACYDESRDILDILSESELNLSKISGSTARKDFEPIIKVYKDFTDNLEEKIRLQREGKSIEVETGFEAIDMLTGGLCRSDLIIVAARPGMGKTAYALSVTRNTALWFNRAVGIMSLEMSSQQLVGRLVSMVTKIEASRIKSGKLSDEDIMKILNANALINSKIFIDDTGGMPIVELRAKARRMKAKHNIELLIVDYLQLVTTDGNKNKTRENEVSQVSQALKALAKELNIPVMALSQLSREPEKRADKRPQLSDLRESGAIEQDADVVQFIHRPSYYKVYIDEQGNDITNSAEVITAKQRNGGLGTEYLDFIPEYTEFVSQGSGGVKPLAPNGKFEVPF